MPFINVKMYPGRSEEKRRKLALALGDTAMEVLGTRAEAFVIAVEEVAKEDWHDKVSVPEVDGNPNVIVKNKPREEW
ncbi:MAG: 4-oxalocrotonate tautomerase [Clostridiales bacterium]|nr:4-oxalocrotonate tautomerase [Clostridiales bacterium]